MNKPIEAEKSSENYSGILGSISTLLIKWRAHKLGFYKENIRSGSRLSKVILPGRPRKGCHFAGT